MTEEEARQRVRRLTDNAGYLRLERLAALVIAENDRQNLISQSTLGALWCRHILDSVQLVGLAPSRAGTWIDIGTGGGFPGLAVAAIVERPFLLVEPRRLRATFLREAASALNLPHVTVCQARIESVDRPAAMISARAVAPIEKLLQAAARCGRPTTRWLFLRGKSDEMELSRLRTHRPGTMFHVKHSETDPAAVIMVADGSGR